MPLHAPAIVLLFMSPLLGATSVVAGPPPSSTRIEGVQVQVLRSVGQVAGAVARGTTRSGDITQEQAELRSMLDTLHGLDFFRLPDRMTARTSVVRREDGTEQTQVLRMIDESTTRVCVRSAVPAYEKCVTFTASAGPVGLVQWADRMMAQVVSR